MPDYSRLAMSGATIACALGIGYFIQSGSGPEPTDTLAELPVEAPVIASETITEPGGDTLELEEITLTSALRNRSVVTSQSFPPSGKPVRAALVSHALPKTPKDPKAPRLGCAVSAKADAVPGALVKLSVHAPCAPNERVTLHHQGLMFTQVTDDAGKLTVTAPALRDHAIYVVALSNGAGTVAQTQVDDMADHRRVILQWADQTGFELHAREFGAAYGTPGHVWHGADPTAGTGHLFRLGDPDAPEPRLADVYSFPKSAEVQNGTVAFSVETEVTAKTCGRAVEAQVLQVGDTGRLSTREIALTMPNCSAIGDFLVLNKVMDTLKIASK